MDRPFLYAHWFSWMEFSRCISNETQETYSTVLLAVVRILNGLQFSDSVLSSFLCAVFAFPIFHAEGYFVSLKL